MVQGSGFRVEGAGFRVQGAGFRVQGSGCGVQGVGFTRAASSKTSPFRVPPAVRVSGLGLVCSQFKNNYFAEM